VVVCTGAERELGQEDRQHKRRGTLTELPLCDIEGQIPGLVVSVVSLALSMFVGSSDSSSRHRGDKYVVSRR
jgi:hypothetical protein